jgi:hypothetical protein
MRPNRGGHPKGHGSGEEPQVKYICRKGLKISPPWGGDASAGKFPPLIKNIY